MKRFCLAAVIAGLSALHGAWPVWGESCQPLPVSSAGQLGCSVALHAGHQPAAALGANLGGNPQSGSVTLCLLGAHVECEPPLTPADGQAGDEFGRSVAVDDDWVAVGSPFAKGNGEIYLYHRDGGSLTLGQELTASDGARGDQFGLTLALSGDTLIVGAPNAVGTGGSLSGVVYIFHLDGGTWKQTQTLTAGDARPFDNFGFSLAIDGSLAIVGAPFHDGATGNSGAAYVFQRTGERWSQQERLTASDGAANAEYGSAVAVSGSALAVGARAAGAGQAYVYEPDGSGWREVARFAGEKAGDRFGVSAAMTGNGSQLVIGSLLRGGTGAAYLYERKDSEWVQDGPLLLGGAQGDRFGQAAAADGGSALAAGYLAQGSVGRVCLFDQPLPIADVSVTLSAPDSIQPGRTLAQKLTVTNHGPDTATGVHVKEDIPTGLELDPASLPAGCKVAAGTTIIDCALPDLAAGAKQPLFLSFQVLESCVPAIQAQATVSAIEDSEPASSLRVLTVLVRRADLAIAQTSPPFVAAGALIPTVLTVTNNGPDIACGVVVNDFLPAAPFPGVPIGCEPVGTKALRCSLDELDAGASHPYGIGFKAPPGAKCGASVLNTATVSAVPAGADPRSFNNSRSVPTATTADLSITKKVDRTIAGPNQPLVYTIVVGNPDGCAATVQDDFPAELTQVLWCRDVEGQGSCVPTRTDPLSDGVTGGATYRAQGFVRSGFLGKLANTATVEGPAGAFDPVPANNSATAVTVVVLVGEDIPTLSGSALAALALLLTLLALRLLRRRSSL